MQKNTRAKQEKSNTFTPKMILTGVPPSINIGLQNKPSYQKTDFVIHRACYKAHGTCSTVVGILCAGHRTWPLVHKTCTCMHTCAHIRKYACLHAYQPTCVHRLTSIHAYFHTYMISYNWAYTCPLAWAIV